MIPQSMIDRAKQADMVSLLQNANVRSSGRQDYRGECPICSQAFCAQPSKHRWVCNCTGRRWRDTIDLMMQWQHLSFQSAVELLSDEQIPRLDPATHKKTEPELRWWQHKPRPWLDQSLQAFDRIPAWQGYKPISVDAIAKCKLGVGKQPGVTCHHRRLIVPIVVDGRIVNFRGRSFECDCAKWMTSAQGPLLYGLKSVKPGDTVVWVENNIDAILIWERVPGIKAVSSTHGAYAWRNAQLPEQLAAANPGVVIVMLDNDHAGNPNAETWTMMNEQHRLKTGRDLPRPNGIQIAERLYQLGVRVRMHEWPAGTPKGFDAGSALCHL